MNYDSRHEFSPEKKRSRWRPYLLRILGIIIVFGFFFFVMSMRNNGNGTGNGNGNGNGTASGAGYGKADSGDGRNAKGTAEKDGADSEGKQSGKSSASAQSQARKSPSKIVPTADEKNTDPSSAETVKTVPVKKRLIALNVSAVPESNPNGDDETGDGSRGGRKGAEGFYGINVRGNSIFVVDVSESMSSNTKEGMSRIQILKVQLENMIRTTYKKSYGTKYCVIAFSSGGGCGSFGSSNAFTVFPAKRLKRFSDGYDRDVKKFVAGLQASGGTDLLSAMQEAIRIIANEDNNIKTIFLLTDGEPNSGWFNIQDLIYKKIKKSIVINCISIGRACPEMKQIANDYEGKYKEIL